MNEIVQSNKKTMEAILKQNRAEKREFLAVVKSTVNCSGSPNIPGGVVNTDENDGEKLEYNGLDLMTLYASEKPSLFGRELARVLFGEGKQCELINTLITGPLTPTRKNTRMPCDNKRKKLFEGKK